MSAINTVAIQEEPVRSFRSVLFVTDFSETSVGALKWLKIFAKQVKAKVLIAHFDQVDVDDPEPHLSKFPDVAQRLQQVKNECRRDCDLNISVSVFPLKRDKPFVMDALEEQIKEIVKAHEIDLILLGTHGYRGLKKMLFGSFAETIFRHTDCPVMIVGPGAAESTPQDTISKVLFATDFERESISAFPVAAAFANEVSGTLVLAHVDRTPRLLQMRESDGIQRLRKLAASMPVFSGMNVGAVELAGLPEEQIAQYAAQQGIGTIVLGVRTDGAHDPLGLRIPGSLTCAIIAKAPCPVLTFRGSYQGHARFFRASSGF